MTNKEILTEAMRYAERSQSDLAEMAGVSRGTISSNIRRDNMGLDIFVHYLNLMGYSVYVGSKKGDDFVPRWEVTPGNTKPRELRATLVKNGKNF